MLTTPSLESCILFYIVCVFSVLLSYCIKRCCFSFANRVLQAIENRLLTKGCAGHTSYNLLHVSSVSLLCLSCILHPLEICKCVEPQRLSLLRGRWCKQESKIDCRPSAAQDTRVLQSLARLVKFPFFALHPANHNRSARRVEQQHMPFPHNLAMQVGSICCLL